MRDIGNWLDVYLNHPGPKPINEVGYINSYSLEELGITNHQSADWQQAAALMLWELGWWLDENLAYGGDRVSPSFRNRNLVENKPKFYLNDVGVSQMQSYRWQRLAHIFGITMNMIMVGIKNQLH